MTSSHRKTVEVDDEESDLKQEEAQELTGDPSQDALLATPLDGQNIFQAAIRRLLWRRQWGKQ